MCVLPSSPPFEPVDVLESVSNAVRGTTIATILVLNVSNASLGASAVVAQPNARTLYLANLNFVEVFAASLASFQSVMAFTCSNCMLQDVPSAIYELRELRECRLPTNQLQKLPTQFQDLQIELLDLSANQFAQVPDLVWRMRKLQTLDLTRNLVASCADPAQTGQPLNASLATLILDENPLAGLSCSLPNLESISLQRIPSLRTIPDLVFRLSKLKRVILSGNPQLQLTIGSQVSLSITEVHLASCELTRAPLQLIDSMPELRVLDLSQNRIAALDDSVSAATWKLQVLNLNENQLTNMSAVVSFATTVSGLTELHVAANNFSSCRLSSARSSIEIFNLSSNALRSCDIALPKLRVLDLSNNQLRAVPMSTFALPNLEELYLTGNPIDPWTLRSDELAFLAKLSQFRIQQSAFASCPVAEQQRLHDYSVCVNASTLAPLTRSPFPDVSSNSSGSEPAKPIETTARSDKLQPVYIVASFVLAVAVALIAFLVMKKRRESKPAAVVSSPGSVAFLESPTRFGGDDQGDDPIFPGIVYEEDVRSEDAIEASSKSIQSASQSNLSVLSRSVFTSSFRAPGESDSLWVDDELMAWRVDYDSVQLQTCLSSSSAFVEVWEATYRLGQVAVKRLKPSKHLFYQKHAAMVDPVVMGKFIMEIKVLSRLDHPRIVAFYGVAWTSEATILCVMEYMPQQDLQTFLQRQREESRKSSRSSASLVAHEWSDKKFSIALDVLEALAYLHSLDPVLVHCNLKSRNVLLTNTLQAKVSDFGISKYLGTSSSAVAHTAMTRPHDEASGSSGGSDDGDGVMDEMRHLLSQSGGSIRWTAPEVLLAYTHYSEAVDIYAFGVLLSELDTLQLPYEGLRSSTDGRPISDAAIRRRVAKGELRPEFSPRCPREVLDIAHRCLAYDPHDRPSSLALLYELRQAGVAVLSSQSARASLKACSSAGSNSSSSSGVSSTETDWSRRTIELKSNRRLSVRS